MALVGWQSGGIAASLLPTRIRGWCRELGFGDQGLGLGLDLGVTDRQKPTNERIHGLDRRRMKCLVTAVATLSRSVSILSSDFVRGAVTTVHSPRIPKFLYVQ